MDAAFGLRGAESIAGAALHERGLRRASHDMHEFGVGCPVRSGGCSRRKIIAKGVASFLEARAAVQGR
jgi:hypothetical protein